MTRSEMEELYRRWYKPIRAWVRRSNVPSQWVEDVVQDVFVRLLRYDLGEVENVGGYMFKVAANATNEWMARSCFSKNHVDFDDLGEGVIGVADVPEAALENIEFQKAIEIRLSRVQGRKLLILMFRLYEEKTYKEIADELGLTYRTVLRDLVHTYSQLRVEFQDLLEETGDERFSRIHDGRASSGTVCDSMPSLRPSEDDVGIFDRVYNGRASHGDLSGSPSIQRPDDSSEESGRFKHTETA